MPVDGNALGGIGGSGGGGYYGGGGGGVTDPAVAGGGGGGSDLAAGLNQLVQDGVHSGDGTVTITYTTLFGCSEVCE